MRHRKAGRKFGMDASQRKAMLRNMVTSLMVHGQIRTTTARAKELRGLAERMITLGKRAPSEGALTDMSGDALRAARADRVAAIRRAKRWVHDDAAIKKIFGEYAERFRARPGGYTRVVKIGLRAGDKADMAVISLVGDFDPTAAKPSPVSDVIGETVESAKVASEE